MQDHRSRWSTGRADQGRPAFGAIHDAAYNYVPEDDVDIWVPSNLDLMENLPLYKVGWEPQLEFTADAKIGPSMGEFEKVRKESSTGTSAGGGIREGTMNGTEKPTVEKLLYSKKDAPSH